jgi:uncharacterized membrane protein (UPF0136 family)
MITTSPELTNSQDEIRGVDSTHSAGAYFLLVLAFIGGLIGLLFSSQATSGVAILAFSILLAIVARILQANVHHAALLRQIRRR